jgi:hypothetical protein
MSDMMNMLGGGQGKGGGGMIGTPSEPFNPAAKLATGVPMPREIPPATPSPTTPADPSAPPPRDSLPTQIGKVVMPDTMRGLQGKGGASG